MPTVQELLSNDDLLLRKRPFFRGGETFKVNDPTDGNEYIVQSKTRAVLPNVNKRTVSQERFLLERDPNCHNVMFDDNIPKIWVKMKDGYYYQYEFKRMGLPFQERILEKQTLHLCGNRTEFTLRKRNPSDVDKENFAVIKEYWEDRNMDGMRTKAISTQKGLGDCGLLFYYNSRGEIRCRLISYEDGYVIISHNDDNGERALEVIYYKDDYGNEIKDCYDFKNRYRITTNSDGERVIEVTPHGFDEIPVVTKRGDVAWNNSQSTIEMYETMYNLFLFTQKRLGFGILYVKGKFKEQAAQIAGNVILNDTSIDGKGDAKMLTNNATQGMIEYLNDLFEKIQISSSTTFLLPKDIKTGGDISAIAIMLTQSLDLECAEKGVIDWQNFMDKMMRLFKQGLAKELVNNGINPRAVTDFAKLRISTKLKVWRPFNETEYNNMLISLKGAGIISTKTAIEKNTISKPDEEARIDKELEGKILSSTKTIEEPKDGIIIEE